MFRSLHPTHSVAAIGKDAEGFTEGEEYNDSPCSRKGCHGKLYDRKAKILFLGCNLNRNTFLHGVEEWNQIPNRLTSEYAQFSIVMPDGSVLPRPMLRHHTEVGDISKNYGKMLQPFLHKGIGHQGKFGDADCVLCDAVGMADLVSEYLMKNQDLFYNSNPIPTDWYL